MNACRKIWFVQMYMWWICHINFFNGEYFVVDKDRDGIAHELYWSIRDRLSLNVLDVFTCLYKDQQI